MVMASASKNHLSSAAKPCRTPVISAATDIRNPNFATTTSSSIITTPVQDRALSRASHLTRPELLRRRSHYLRQLSKCYRVHYWTLMEDLKVQYRNYYLKFGLSPFREDYAGAEFGNGDARNLEGSGENANSNHVHYYRADFDPKGFRRCAFVGCKLKAMALTSFCHLHILSDSKQKLYKACKYVIKSAQAGPIICGKPILRSSAPSLCPVHVQRAQKHITRAFKKAGLNVSSSSRLAPKFHVIVAEYIHQIQAKRRATQQDNGNKVFIKEESAG